MAVLSENNNTNDLEDNEEIYPDTFLQDEFLMLNHDLKEKVRLLLDNNNKINLEPKELKTLIEVLKESYEFDYKLKERIHTKKRNYKYNSLKRVINKLGDNYSLKRDWDWDLEDKRDY